MAKFAKSPRKAFKKQVQIWRNGVRVHSPQWVRRAFGPAALYADMLLTDHGIFRMFYLNKHRLSTDVWRAAQPAPHHIRKMARKGIKTIINLRGGNRTCGSYWLEEKLCKELGIELVNYQVRSRAAPSKDELRGAKELFTQIEYPILMHCKSGADRAGLMSVLYCIWQLDMPVETAMKQLHWKFGHIRQADTGILDFFFQRYVNYNAETPISFIDWIETVYDPEDVAASYHAGSFANTVVNKVLRRE